ncbi:MAG: ABC transporter substrate-binding protein [Proteobacteria bacterium]|nr:ABC transporter substrate-binding protein [Pseudomonadota bacterium]
MGRIWLQALFFSLLLVEVGFSATRVFVDEVGRWVKVPDPPKRIVSLSPSITEILFCLGLEERIVGVSNHSDFPLQALAKPRVGSYINPNVERTISLNPDLILATAAGNPREFVDRMESLGLSVYTVFPKDFDGILTSISHIAMVTGREQHGARVIREMRSRKERILQLTRGRIKPKVFFQIGTAPIVTVGKGSFADDLISLAGGRNIAGGESMKYPRYSLEEILVKGPDVIIITSMDPRGDSPKLAEQWNRWETIPAVKQGRVFVIDSDLVDLPSPRIIDGLEGIARILHPELKGILRNQ